MEKSADPKQIDDPKFEERIRRYVTDPEGVSLEEKLELYQHALKQVPAESEDAGIIRQGIDRLREDLKRAGAGDPAFVLAPGGTYRKKEEEMKRIPPDQLSPDPANQDLFRNIEGEDFEQLKASIEEIGMIEPIIADPKLRIICGHQRWRAALAIGLSSVPVILRSVDEEESRAIMTIEENIHRRQLQPSEMARAVKKLTELKERKNKVREIAKEIGLSQSQLYAYRDLSRLIPEISVLLDHGRLTQKTALQIAQLDEEIQRGLYEALGERMTQLLNEQKMIEFRKANADLIRRAEELSAEAEEDKAYIAKLKEEKKGLQEYLNQAEFKGRDLLQENRRLEEEMEKTQAESYRRLQEKEAVISKITRNVEPKVVPPADYQPLKEENARLKAIVKELETLKAGTSDAAIVDLCRLLVGQLVSLDLTALKVRLSASARRELPILASDLEGWVRGLKSLAEDSSPEGKRTSPAPRPK